MIVRDLSSNNFIHGLGNSQIYLKYTNRCWHRIYQLPSWPLVAETSNTAAIISTTPAAIVNT